MAKDYPINPLMVNSRARRTIKLGKWFPPNDPFAAAVARLCILREDFYLELEAIRPDKIDQLDGNSVEWRKIYFFRNAIRTLMEIRGSMEFLQRQKEFRIALSKQPESAKDSFKRFFKEITAAHEIIKKLRNAIGGHVDNKAVEEALHKMHSDRKGLIEFGEKGRDVHFKFSSELIMAILLAGVPDKDQETKLDMMIGMMVDLRSSLQAIDIVFSTYALERGLRL